MSHTRSNNGTKEAAESVHTDSDYGIDVLGDLGELPSASKQSSGLVSKPSKGRTSMSMAVSKQISVRSTRSQRRAGSKDHIKALRHDDSDDDLGKDLTSLPVAMQIAAPLHLREETILKVGTRSKMADPPSTPSSRRSTKDNHEVEVEKPKKSEPAPFISVHPSYGVLACGSCIALIWAALIIVFLGLYVMRYQNPVGNDLHMGAALGAIETFQAEVTAILAPAVGLMRTLALDSQSGILWRADDHVGALRSIIDPVLASVDSIQYVQIVGAMPASMVVVRPGTLRIPMKKLLPGDTNHDHVEVYASTICASGDPFGCFQLNSTGMELTAVKFYSSMAGWLGPSYLTTGLSGQNSSQVEDVADWTLVHHLLAFVNVTMMPGMSAYPAVAMDIAIAFDDITAAAHQARPANGAIILCTVDGLVLSATGWSPEPPKLTTLWDAPYAWVAQITEDMMASPSDSSFFYGRDLVVIQSIVTGFDAGPASFRAIVYMPRDSALTPLLTEMSLAAVAIIAAPFAAVIFLGIFLLVRMFCRWCCWHRGNKADEADEENDEMLTPAASLGSSNANQHNSSLAPYGGSKQASTASQLLAMQSSLKGERTTSNELALVTGTMVRQVTISKDLPERSDSHDRHRHGSKHGHKHHGLSNKDDSPIPSRTSSSKDPAEHSRRGNVSK